MDDRTRAALEESIKHWEENAAAETPEGVSTGAENCPLCYLFFDANCQGCPVRRKTGEAACTGSPYNEAYFALHDWAKDGKSRDIYRMAAQAEVDFLRSLLPTG